MKIFEIPYNFDRNLIDELIKIDPTGNLYHSIYIPPYYDDYFAAKRNYIHLVGNDMQIQQNIKRSIQILSGKILFSLLKRTERL